MSSSDPPPARATERWRQLADNPSPRRQALLTAAAIVADDLAQIGYDDPVDEHDRAEHWCRIAVLIYELLHETYSLVDEADSQQCRIDQAAVRTWLASTPTRPGHASVAAAIGATDRLRRDAPDVDHRVAGLLEAAIRAGHLSMPGHRIDLLHLADGPGRIAEHLIVARRLNHSSVVSTRLRGADLIEPGWSGIDAALGVLARTATILNDLMGLHGRPAPTTRTAPASPAADPAINRRPTAHAFPEIDLHTPPAAPTPPPATSPRPRGRRR